MGFCCTRLAWFRHGDDRDVTGNKSVSCLHQGQRAFVLLWFQGAQDKAKSVRVRAKRGRKILQGLRVEMHFVRVFTPRLPHRSAQTASWQSPSRLVFVCFALVSGSARQSQVCRGVAQKRGREILQGLRVEMHFVRVFTPRLPHRSAQTASWQSPSRLVFVCFALVSGSARQSQACQGARKTRTGNPARLACRDAFRSRLRTSSAAPERAQAASWQSPSRLVFVCFALVSGSARQSQACQGARKTRTGNPARLACRDAFRAHFASRLPHQRAQAGFLAISSRLVCVCFALVSGSARQSQVCRGVAQKRGREILQGLRVEMHFVRVFAPRLPHQRAQAGFLAISKSSGLRLVPCVT